MRIIIDFDDKDFDEMKTALDSVGIGSMKVFAKDESTSLVEDNIKAGSIKMTATQIQLYINNKTGESISVRDVGLALNQLGIRKQSILQGGIVKKGYKVAFIEDERMLRFRQRQDEGFEAYGVKALDYKTPNEFNKAVEYAKTIN